MHPGVLVENRKKNKNHMKFNVKKLIAKYLICVLSLLSATSNSQKGFHLEKAGQVKIPEHASSIWGYTDASGIEYALLGTYEGLRIYSLENPSKPLELKFIQEFSSPWREIKTSGNFAYVVNESSGGLLVVDLHSPKDSLPHKFVKHFLASTGDTLEFNTAHTLFVDENGLIYLSGAKKIGNAFAILDPSQDPWNPVVIYHNQEHYCHEVFAYRDTIYCAELLNGVFSIFDSKDKMKVSRITDQVTAGHFTHSVWLEKDRKILYTADETEGASVEAWDLTDLELIRKSDSYKVINKEYPTVIPHNVFHTNDRLYVSYYTEGVRILDTRDPYNLVEVAWYDTHEEYKEGFHGCWSVYPFFKNGLCIASDIENGMFVLKYDNNQAAYLEANIRSFRDGSAIHNAKMELNSRGISAEAFSGLNGVIKTGLGLSDTAYILVSKKGFYPYRDTILLKQDSTIYLNIDLLELPVYDVSLQISDRQTGLAIQNAEVVLYNHDFEYRYQSDSLGQVYATNIYSQPWNISAGKWSYQTEFKADVSVNGNLQLQLDLNKAYQDEFLHDLKWTSHASQDSKVSWKRGTFEELAFRFSNFPTEDIDTDFGNYAYYTSNYEISDTAYNLKGQLSLQSPPMDLSAYDEIELSYHAWAYGGYQSTKQIWLQLNDTLLYLENVSENLSGQFNPVSSIQLNVEGYKRDSAHFIFTLYNHPDSFYKEIRLIAAFDGFQCKGKVNSGSKNTYGAIEMNPNPAQEYINLILPDNIPFPATLNISDLYGRVHMKLANILHGEHVIKISELPPGMYWLYVSGRNFKGTFVKM
ncbi:MAG: choice-of-anchor B family protein [Saprospiraceae bacterium]|nr:choice-of-anchor B family protein [Saprospiraceae bacterium]